MGMRMFRGALLALSIFALVGCGSGSGGDVGAAAGPGTGTPAPGGSSTPTPPAGTDTDIHVSGTAAKGLLFSAIVTVHLVEADGQINPTPVGTTTTDAAGNFSLRFTGNPARAYVVKVTAQATTTHADEFTGQQQPLPAGFAMRAVVSSAPNGAIQVTITPLTEMATAAAARANGGLNAANIERAGATLRQLFGFDPARVAVKAPAQALTPDEQRLAILLHAISSLANNGGLQCTTGNAAERSRCVVDALAAALTLDSLDLSAGGKNVSLELARAILAMLPRLAGTIPPSAASAILANLKCANSSCAVVITPPPVPPNPVPAAIAAARGILDGVRSDMTALFVPDAGTQRSAFSAEAHRFVDTMRHLQLPAEMLLKDASALLAGIDHYNDYRQGRTTATGFSRADDAVARGPGVSPYFTLGGLACTLYQDAGATVVATAPANANVIGCSARYYYSLVSVPASPVAAIAQWRHRFVITPTGGGTFTYRAKPRETYASPQTGTVDIDLQPAVAAATGSVTTTTGANGQIESFSISGSLPASFKFQSSSLVPSEERSDWNLSGTRSTDASQAMSQVSGGITARDSAGRALSILSIHTGKLVELAVARNPNGQVVAPGCAGCVAAGRQIAGGELDVTWTRPGAASFEGRFAALNPGWTKTRATHLPSEVVLSGKLTNIDAAGASTSFLSGSASVQIGDPSQYDEQAPDSPANYLDVLLTAQGSVTAPGRPQLTFLLSTSTKTFLDKPPLVSLQYRSVVAGTPRAVLNFDYTTGGTPKLTFSEAASGLSLAVVKGAESAPLMLSGTTKIGVLDINAGVLTFTDGTFMSLDIGQ